MKPLISSMFLAEVEDLVFAPGCLGVDATKQERDNDNENTSAQRERTHKNARVASNANRKNTHPKKQRRLSTVSAQGERWFCFLQHQESAVSLNESKEAKNVANNIIASEDKDEEARKNLNTSHNQKEHAINADDKGLVEVSAPTIITWSNSMLVIRICLVPPDQRSQHGQSQINYLSYQCSSH
jgi:hypothetical protein